MKLKNLFLVSLVCAFLAPSSAIASDAYIDPYPFEFKKDNFYVSLNAGVTFLNDIDFGSDLNFAGVTANVSGTGTFDTGWSLEGTFGYKFNEFIRGEFNLGYTEMDHDEVKATGTITSGGTNLTVSGSADVKGQVDALYGLTNVILSPLGSKSFGGGELTPLVGGGIGFVYWEDSIDTISTSTTTLEVGGKETATDFASNVIAGLEYSQNENLLIGIRYRHAWIDSGKNGFDNSQADQVSGTLTYRF